eukprot:4365683-Prymnesium_polylepis.1
MCETAIIGSGEPMRASPSVRAASTSVLMNASGWVASKSCRRGSARPRRTSVDAVARTELARLRSHRPWSSLTGGIPPSSGAASNSKRLSGDS